MSILHRRAKLRRLKQEGENHGEGSDSNGTIQEGQQSGEGSGPEGRPEGSTQAPVKTDDPVT